MEFQITEKDLGKVLPGSTSVVEFEYTGDDSGNVNLEASCGCTAPVLDYQKKVIRASYVAPIIPHTIQSQETWKNITITHNGNVTVVRFKSNVVHSL
jgi:hypothetical protein